ncbi:MAG TPA: 3',5'-cyclic-nucleotide phosphodiesterase, partial [Thermoanaerobaculia bacterium]|nr:3',5'-cyclic-nucleotide phosphodiesterase [Thermoanaerobaculia bacterium]
CRMTCLLIDGGVALDAGSLTQVLPIERQVGVHSILLTHSHMDHTSSLPFFIENVYGQISDPIDLYASEPTIYAIRKYLFNNATWPDFTRLPNHLLPAIRFHELQAGVAIELGGVRFTPVPVDHVVPTIGFLIEGDGRAVLWSSDTGPTRRLWEVANRTRGLQAVCLDTSFDNSLQEVADISLHLTPRTLERELEKLEVRVPVLLHHLKPPCVARIHREVQALGRPDVDFLEQGKVYRF